MNDSKEFTFNFFIDNLKKYYFLILLLMVIVDYILYYQLGFELSYFTYIIDVNFDVDRIIWAMFFPTAILLYFFIGDYFYKELIKLAEYKNLYELNKFMSKIYFLTISYIIILMSIFINEKTTFEILENFIIDYFLIFGLTIILLISISLSFMIFKNIILKFCFNYLIDNSKYLKYFYLFLGILATIFMIILYFIINNNLKFNFIITNQFFQFLLVVTIIMILIFIFLLSYSFFDYAFYFSGINIFKYFYIFMFITFLFINFNFWHDLKYDLLTNKIEFRNNFSFNLFLNPFLLQTNNYETLLEIDKKGVLEKEFNDKDISYLIVDINNTKYIRVPIDGEKVETNSTKLITSKILPLSKNNAIHFIINPTKCDYENQTCDIVALMTSYHLVGNREYYKLLTYSIIEGKY